MYDSYVPCCAAWGSFSTQRTWEVGVVESSVWLPGAAEAAAPTGVPAPATIVVPCVLSHT